MRTEAAMPAARLRVVSPDEITPEAALAREERSAHRVMAALVVPAFALVVIGLVFVLSASSVRAFSIYGNSFWYFERQAIAAVIGLVAGLIAYRVPYRAWRGTWVLLVGASIALLMLVLTGFGTTAGGSTRWIPLGSFSFQPSEVAKVAVAVAGAALLARSRRLRMDPFRLAAPFLFIVLCTVGLILLQPDLGTTMIVCAIAAALLFAAGIRMRTLTGWFTVAAAGGLLVALSNGYMRARFEAFLHPWSNRMTSGYQAVQGMIALGSGHLWGVGLGASRQKWMYVPNAHTDFIFAIMGEEVGLIGEVVVLGLFAVMLYAGIRIAIRSPDLFGRLLATGIVTWLGVQALVNLGGVTGLLPITGVPLPLLSYGGSSLVVTMIGIGVLASIARSSLPAGGSRPTRRARGPNGSGGSGSPRPPRPRRDPRDPKPPGSSRAKPRGASSGVVARRTGPSTEWS
jgi:cell division protein FtsW